MLYLPLRESPTNRYACLSNNNASAGSKRQWSTEPPCICLWSAVISISVLRCLSTFGSECPSDCIGSRSQSQKTLHGLISPGLDLWKLKHLYVWHSCISMGFGVPSPVQQNENREWKNLWNTSASVCRRKMYTRSTSSNEVILSNIWYLWLCGNNNNKVNFFSSALDVWLQLYPKLRMQKTGSDFCDTCTQFRNNILAAKDSETL